MKIYLATVLMKFLKRYQKNNPTRISPKEKAEARADSS